MSTTLGQSSLNFSNVRNENDSTTKSSNDATIRLNEPKRKQLIIKNINDLPRHELDEFLKVSICFFRKTYFLLFYIEIWSYENSIR
jgi:hypothetical protein